MTANSIKQFHDLDLFVDMLAADKAHIDRAKAKAEPVRLAQEQARVTRRMEITASSTVALAGLWTFLAAWLA